jgi:hypothetical protein
MKVERPATGKCDVCGKEFPYRKGKKYCSGTCRVRGNTPETLDEKIERATNELLAIPIGSSNPAYSKKIEDLDKYIEYLKLLKKYEHILKK